MLDTSDRTTQTVETCTEFNIVSPVIELQQHPHYLVFELGYTGHFSHYIKHLANYWYEQGLPGKITFIVSPKFAQHHAEVLEVGKSVQPKHLQFLVLSEAEASCLTPRESAWQRAKRSLQEWRLLRQYAQSLGATHCLLLYFDSFQTAVMLGRSLSCSFSGIYFRPTLHYPTFNQFVSSRKAHMQIWRERFTLPLILRHAKLKNLFCLDPFFVDFAHQNLRSKASLYLPDPVELGLAQSEDKILAFKHQLGIDAGRTTFLLFGALYDKRKGVAQVLEAMSQIPSTICQKICLLLVGQLGDHQASSLRSTIHRLTTKNPLQVIIRDNFIPDNEVALCFQATDIVLAPYQRHVGMSGIVVHAAAAQKPLIASNYGLLGEVVRQYHLGLTVDSTIPNDIAMGIQHCLEVPLDTLGNYQKMASFAQQNSAEKFSDLIFKTLRSS